MTHRSITVPLRELYKVNIVCTAEQEGTIDFGGLPTVRYNRDLLLIEPTEKQNGIRRMVDRLACRTRTWSCSATA